MKSDPVHSRKPLDWFGDGQYLRPIPLDDEIKELCHSIVESGVLQPLSALDCGGYGIPFIGLRRLTALRWGASQGLPVQPLIPVMLYPSDTPPETIQIAQITENIQRSDMSDVQLYQSVVGLEQLGLSRKEIGGKLGRSIASISRYFAPDHVSDAARQAFLDGKLSLGQTYQISTSETPDATLDLLLNGATREQATRRPKAPSQAPRYSKLKIATSGGGTLTFSDLEWDMPSVVEELTALLKDAKKNLELNHDIKTWQAIRRDRAAAGC